MTYNKLTFTTYASVRSGDGRRFCFRGEHPNRVEWANLGDDRLCSELGTLPDVKGEAGSMEFLTAITNIVPSTFNPEDVYVITTGGVYLLSYLGARTGFRKRSVVEF
jgi:hypothetical protein